MSERLTPLEQEILDRISQVGPIPFSEFMELALYHPEFGYYTRPHADPFGRSGDFFTASQMQPVFGRVIAGAIGDLYRGLGKPADFQVVELGAGRQELRSELEGFHYTPVDLSHRSGQRKLPERFSGVVFSNEFFDALPVDLAVRHGRSWIERRVAQANDRFVFVDGGSVDARIADYLERYTHPEQRIAEIHLRSLDWMHRIVERLENGFVLTIDYGYRSSELVRFPEGTLMSYCRHRASAEVLSDPGQRDITSHVPFDVLEIAGTQSGLETVQFETLGQWLIRQGDHRLKQSIEGGHELQLKTLLFGMGEGFRVLLQRKAGSHSLENGA